MRHRTPRLSLTFILIILFLCFGASPTFAGLNSLLASIGKDSPQAGGRLAAVSRAWPRPDDSLLPLQGRGAALRSLALSRRAVPGAIAGRVTDPSGRPLAGIRLSLQGEGVAGGPLVTLTAWDGSYEFPAAAGGYTLTPEDTGYRFYPAQIVNPTGQESTAAGFTAVACLPNLPECTTPPLLDLPLDTGNRTAPLSVLLLGNAVGQGPGLVNAWYDHTSPTYAIDDRITRWDGQEFSARGRQGVSWYDGHDGTDFSPALGTPDTLVFPAASGVITRTVSGCLAGDLACGDYLGNQVWIDHGGGFATVYAHLAEVYVQVGEVVLSGEEQARPLGLMGMTGNSRGVNPTHLHFGLYYDPEKDWRSGRKALDPYGFLGAQPDWTSSSGLTSQYLWKAPLMRVEGLDAEGATLESASSRVLAAVGPVEAGEQIAARLVETPPTFAAASGWRSAGVSFLLDLVSAGDWQPVEARPVEKTTLQVNLSGAAIAHLDPQQLALSWWDEKRLAWETLPSRVDLSQGILQARTEQSGRFELQGPLICPEDFQEPDDTARDATGLNSTTLSIRSIFDIPEDEDWFWFVAERQHPIRFRFVNLVEGLQPRLEVYDYTGARLLASLDTAEASYLEWTPGENGAYFLRLSAPAGAPSGCGVKYELLMDGD